MLGIIAALTGIAYALIKFLTASYIRQLQERIHRMQADIQKNQQLIHSLEAQRKVAHTKKDGAQNKLVTTRKRNEDLYFRLQQEIPENLHFQLEKCLTSFPVPNKEEIIVLEGLKGRPSARNSDCLLLVKLSAVPEGPLKTALEDTFAAHNMPFETLANQRVVCTPTSPEAGLTLFTALLNTPLSSIENPSSASLVALEEDSSDDPPGQSTQLLQEAQKLLNRAPAETVLLNAVAYQQLEQANAVQIFDEARSVYAFAPLEGNAHG